MTISRMIWLTLAVSLFLPAYVSAAPEAKMVEAAKKEGTVAYYTGLNVNAVQRLIDAL